MSWRDGGGRRDGGRGGRDRYGDSGGYGGKGGGKGKTSKGGASSVDEDTSRDWECEQCQTRNFARRDQCFKCKSSRPRPPELEKVDPRADRERKLKAAIAMGIDPSMAETVIQDPRFADSIEQYERMQKAQEDQQRELMQAQQAPAPDPTQLLQMAMAQGYTAEQAQAYVAQYLQQHQAQQAAAQQPQSAPATAAAAVPAAPDPAQLIAAAVAQGFTPEQAQAYAAQYLQQHAALTAAAQQQTAAAQPAGASQVGAPPAPPPPPTKESRVALYSNVPLILHIDEGGRRGEHRATLKAVIVDTSGGRRSFTDVFVKGPWRRRREAALKDQEELAAAFKLDGKQSAEKRAQELEDISWKTEELAGVGDTRAADAVEEDDFDAEAESEGEPEPEVNFGHEDLPVKVTGLNQFEGPIQSWEEGVARGCIAPAICQALTAMQLQRPTLIQRYALPLIGRTSCDLLAQAQTGSGKTLAFVIPIVSRLVMQPPVQRPFFPGPMAQASPVALMLSPTRELAIQTSQNVSNLLQYAGSQMTVFTLYGGETITYQLKGIDKHNIDIICATPGRLLDAIDQSKVSLMFATTLVLDEADQMLDLAVGLEGTVRAVTDGRDMPLIDGRQTLLFSATMPDFQTKQFHAVLKAPPTRLKLRVGHYTEDEKGGSCKHIAQTLIRVRDIDERWQRLGQDLMECWGSTAQIRQGKGIIFTNRIAMASPLEQALRRCGITSGQLHGKQTQDMREDVVKRFRAGEYEMLIASNVASRGLDFPDIRIVVQFELPKTVEIYTHRIGRTGRNGQSGTAISYYGEGVDWRLAKPLSEFLRLNEQSVPNWLDDAAGGGGGGGYASSYGGGGSRRSRSRSRRRR